MQLMLPERGKPTGRLVLDQGQLAGRAYRVEPTICGNPVCECQEFTLHCFPETPGEATASPTPLTLELDLGRKILVKPGLAEATPASGLAKAVRDEMTLEQWHYLWNYYYTLKILYTERANLDELETDFPSNASEGGMVGYYEILPFARPINFTAEGCQWAFDDQYCLRPDCSCRAAVLQCFRIAPQNAGATPQGPNLSFRIIMIPSGSRTWKSQEPASRPKPSWIRSGKPSRIPMSSFPSATPNFAIFTIYF